MVNYTSPAEEFHLRQLQRLFLYLIAFTMKILFPIVLALSIIPNSLCAGDRTMSSNADAIITYTMGSWGNNAPALEIKLPEKWKYEKNRGPDFDVHWFRSPDGSGNIGIYIGHHPHMEKADNIQRSKHSVGGKEVEFYSEKRNEIVFTQALVSGFFAGYEGGGVSRLLLHIMINEQKSGFTQKALEALAKLQTRGNN
jgi:hypothetical protein